MGYLDAANQIALNLDPNAAIDAGITAITDSLAERYSVDLQEEEGYGHTLEDHVAKSDLDLISRLERERKKLGPRWALKSNICLPPEHSTHGNQPTTL